jgi:RNA polymerase sigma-32 factor
MVEDARMERYLNKLSAEPLLSKNEELELAKVIQDPNSTQDKKDEAISKLVLANMRFAISEAIFYSKMSSIDFNDMLQDASEGLTRAAKKFRPEFNVKFISYAKSWIKFCSIKKIRRSIGIKVPNHMVQKVINYKKAIEANPEISTDELMAELGVTKKVLSRIKEAARFVLIHIDGNINNMDEGNYSSHEIIADVNSPDPCFEAKHNEDISRLHEYINKLPERKKNIIVDRFINKMKLHEIGEKINLTNERIRQISNEAIEDLKAMMEDNV